jgi:hypothetical protein
MLMLVCFPAHQSSAPGPDAILAQTRSLDYASALDGALHLGKGAGIPVEQFVKGQPGVSSTVDHHMRLHPLGIEVFNTAPVPYHYHAF